MLVVLAVSMIKAGVEDLMKHQEDNARNNTPVTVFRDQKWQQIRSKEVQVGDIIKITNDSMVPSDILFISSSNESHICYYSESELNGETTIKVMLPHPFLEGCDDKLTQLIQNQYQIEVKAPDRDLTSYDCRIKCNDNFWPISIHNVLLRGMCTHYTNEIIGIVIRTGHDTKIMQNVQHPPSKLTKFDHNLNRILILIFSLMVILCFLCTFLGVKFDKGGSFKFIDNLYPGYGNSFLQYFVQYFILFSYMFPISMTVTIEIIRTYNKVLISYDPLLRDKEYGKGFSNNSNVICQLGLIDYILSDKTGTLTENKMKLEKLAIGNIKFDANKFIEQVSLDKNLFETSLPMLLSFALCNNVIVHNNNDDGTIKYDSDSPDEAAFVSFAAKCGVKLIFRSQTSIEVEILNERKEYKILAMLKFTSERKRMSILLQHENEPVILYTKGADTVLSQMISNYAENDISNEFANLGLRTLMFCTRKIENEELDEFIDAFHFAESSLINREEQIENCITQIEKNMKYIGITGIEDCLQDKVPETIQWLKDAGLKIFVITGDKLETAVAIGKTSKIISTNSNIIIINSSEISTIKRILEENHENLGNFSNVSLIIQSNSFEVIMNNNYFDEFWSYVSECDSIIFARVSPYIKGKIAELICETGVSTLAIGDGANDIGMLQKANIGVGVRGNEGSQATTSSDFVISRFKHLPRILTIYGHWTYRRFGIVSVLMIYKNIVFISGQIWFAFNTLWSPTALYNDFLMSMFNLLFTVLPPFIFGFWEQDLPQDVMFKYPQLYKCEFNPMKMINVIGYVILGYYHSLCCYFGVKFLMPNFSLIEFGTISYLATVYVVVFQVMIWLHMHNVMTTIFFAINIVLAPIIIVIYAYGFDPNLWLGIEGAWTKINIWIGWIMVLFVALFPAYLLTYLKAFFRPSNARLHMEKIVHDPIGMESSEE
ncbi:phospholipid-translocating P-type ATPase, flippase family protein [Histomonas meleagridis]|uniref:phospholipid-translocating P-type ATPase, flippase family protein n=1 Tax=Histomonas meleagridis TaxID=135588 RepID=UPI00355A0121|nr:phospholipid-translocating P-type ATPase, flippase family protein [Histomonas meleagridis]KAH0805124.1 phospholipid-translocating P-type ATPase, flippase family protein [Histomonas meleagridis]